MIQVQSMQILGCNEINLIPQGMHRSSPLCLYIFFFSEFWFHEFFKKSSR